MTGRGARTSQQQRGQSERAALEAKLGLADSQPQSRAMLKLLGNMLDRIEHLERTLALHTQREQE